MHDFHAAGGTPAVMKYLLDEGVLHGDCLTVTGKTIFENLEEVSAINCGEHEIIRKISNPIKKTGHLRVLYGNLAEKGSIAKITGHEGETFLGKAKVFDGEKSLLRVCKMEV